jgi:hypothetical protein
VPEGGGRGRGGGGAFSSASHSNPQIKYKNSNFYSRKINSIKVCRELPTNGISES